MAIIEPTSFSPVVTESGFMQLQFQLFLSDLVLSVNRHDIIIGTGSPEGVVYAVVGQEYMDDSGAAGAIKYIKRDVDIAGDTTKGWILV